MVIPYDFCSCSRTASPEKDTTTSVVIIHPFKNGIILSIVVAGQAVFAGFEPQNDRFRSGQSSCPLNRRTILRPAAVLTRLEVRPGATGLYFDPARCFTGKCSVSCTDPTESGQRCDHIAIDGLNSTSTVVHSMELPLKLNKMEILGDGPAWEWLAVRSAAADRSFNPQTVKENTVSKSASTSRVYRVTELIGTSESSWEDAAKHAVETATKTLRDLRVAEVNKLDLVIVDGKVTAFRARVNLSFKYEDKD